MRLLAVTLLPKSCEGVTLEFVFQGREALMTGMSGEGPVWSLPEVHMKALTDHGTVKSYPKNAVIVNEGDRSDSMYIVLSGRVKAYLADEEGKEVLLNMMGPGEYFGELILDDGPRSASVM